MLFSELRWLKMPAMPAMPANVPTHAYDDAISLYGSMHDALEGM